MKLFVPYPRPPTRTEKAFQTVDKGGKVTDPEDLPCWFDKLARKLARAEAEDQELFVEQEMQPAELLLTLLVPASNAEDRLTLML